MRPWTAGIFAAIASLTAAVTAEAGPFPFNVLFQNFNAITNGNFATNSDVVGPVLVGGNLSGNGILDASGMTQTCCTTPLPNYAEINVFGNNTGTWAEGAGIRAFVGGTNTGSFGSATVTTGYTFPGYNQPGAGSNALTFANDIWAPLTNYSSGAGALTPNSSFTLVSGVLTLTGVPGTNGAIFSIPLSTLNSATSLVLGGCLASSTPCFAYINVTGTGTFVQGFTFPTADDIPGLPNVLFNFVSATGVEWGLHNFDASILAPFAVGSNNGSGPLVGDLVVDSVSATAPLGNEIHFAPFNCIPGTPGCFQGPVLPDEPSALTLFGFAAVGLVAFAAIRQRRGWLAGPGPSGTV